jgi:hypothetical protein
VDKLVEILRPFLTRDIVWIIGGGSVLGAVYPLVGAPALCTWKPPVAIWLFISGVAWALGYAIQDASGLLGLVRVRTIAKAYPQFVRWAYRRWEGCEEASRLDSVTEDQVARGRDVSYQLPDGRESDELQRIITLKLVGTAVGPCWIVAGALLGAKNLLRPPLAASEVGLSVGVFVMGVLLVLLGWLKSAQQVRFYAKLATRPAPACSPKTKAKADSGVTVNVRMPN